MKKCLLIGLLILLANFANAAKQKSKTFIRLQYEQSQGDSLLLLLKPHVVNKTTSKYAHTYIYLNTIGRHEVVFNLETLLEPTYTILEWISKGNKVSLFPGYPMLMVEPGDNILISIKGDKIEVSGKGSAKVKILLELYGIEDVYRDPVLEAMTIYSTAWNDYAHSKDYKVKKEKYNESLVNARLAIISKYKRQLTSFAHDLLITEVREGAKYLKIEDTNLSLNEGIVLSDRNREYALEQFVKAYPSLSQLDTTNMHIKFYSPGYAANIFLLLRTYYRIKRANFNITSILKDRQRYFPVESFEFIENYFKNSRIKDKLLTNLLVQNIEKDTSRLFYNRALSQVSTPYYVRRK